MALIPGKDYPVRMGPPGGMPPTANCEDCGDLRRESDLIRDKADWICAACAVARVEAGLDASLGKVLLGKALSRIARRKP